MFLTLKKEFKKGSKRPYVTSLEAEAEDHIIYSWNRSKESSLLQKHLVTIDVHVLG